MINNSNNNYIKCSSGGYCHKDTKAQGFTKIYLVFLRDLGTLWHNIFKPYFFNIVMLCLLLFSVSCNKEEQPLVLDKDFLTVADLLQYCQGSCDETLDWEGKPAWVKGYIMNFSNDSVRNKYYTDSSFLLQDIRNGMFIEIRVEENKDPVFEKIWPAGYKNLFFIKGTAKPVTATTNGECTKGVIVSLIHPDDINFE